MRASHQRSVALRHVSVQVSAARAAVVAGERQVNSPSTVASNWLAWPPVVASKTTFAIRSTWGLNSRGAQSMRGAIASIILTGIAAAGMFAALSAASRNPQPEWPMPSGMTVVYPAVRSAVPEAPAHPSDVMRHRDKEVAAVTLPPRRIRCAGLADTCFYNGPMGGTETLRWKR